MTVNEKVRARAVKSLDGMAEIVRNEMLVKGHYVTSVVRPDMASSVCGGRRYCAVGALWAAGGVRVDASGELPGVEEHARDGFLAHRPGLRLAYEALNEAARAYIDGLPAGTVGRDVMGSPAVFVGEPGREEFNAPIERLFEMGPWDAGTDAGRRELLGVIEDARRRVMAL